MESCSIDTQNKFSVWTLFVVRVYRISLKILLLLGPYALILLYMTGLLYVVYSHLRLHVGDSDSIAFERLVRVS